MVDQLLSELRRREIRIWADGERLRYDAPGGSLDDRFLALLRAHRQEILACVRLAAHSVVASAVEGSPDRAAPVLSFAQERMWLLWKLHPQSAAYNIAFRIRFAGVLDRDALIAALRAIHRRHEVLRSRVREAIPVVDENGMLEVPLIDVADDEAADQAMRVEAATPFDLEHQPPFAARLYRAGSDRHWLLVKLHHIAADVASITVFQRELAALYAGQALEPLPLQVADFAAWQRKELEGPRRQSLLAFWRKQLDGDIAPLRLPINRPRAAAETARGGRVAFQLPLQLHARLSELRRSRQLTSFMLLEGAFRVLLYRYGNQSDFLIGTPAICRNHVDAERLIGFFGNTLLLRNPLSPDDTWLAALDRERQVALDAYEHQELPYELLSEELGRERTRFQAMFTFAAGDGGAEWLPALTADVAEVETGTAKFDLLLGMQETEEGWSGVFEYAEDLFDRQTIERMAGHFEVLLTDLAERSNGRIAEVSLLTEAEQTFLRAWNATAVEIEGSRCIHELFETQAAAHGRAVAIYHEHDAVSYAALNEQANRIAHRLLAHGIASGERVAVCMRRTPRLVAALLGILKVGAAYVPIDPRYPSERIRLIVIESRAHVLLTERDLAATLPAAIVLDDEPPGGTHNPRVPTRPGDLAYVLFTSGSTGVPKGVMIEHRSATALLDWAHRQYEPEELAGVLASSSVCFDLSVFELFAPLCAGRSVVLADGALALPSLPARDRITLINTVPSAMRVLLARGEGAFPESLRVVNLAGERLETRLVDEVYRRTRARKVFDLYGPTESTTYSTFKLRLPGEKASIGRPIANTRAYVVDPRGVPVPMGMVGELLLAGEGLARGYLHRPELTAEAFVEPSCPSIPESRLYRTSDLVRLTAAGDLEYCGREGDQLKVRGFRVEPGEVRAALLTADGVDDAWVMGREEDGGVGLVAYVAGDARCASVAMLRRHLRRMLPEYMIPTAYIRVEAIPLTPNGKVDVARLQPMPAVDAAVAATPRNDTERELLAVWRDLLDDEEIGTADDFFDCGGHSLTAMRIAARVSEVLELELPLQVVFEHPTVAELASHIDRLRSGVPASSLPPVVARGRDDAPATLLQRHFWLLHHAVRDSSFLNIASAVSFRGPFDLTAAERAFAVLGERHPILRTRFLFSTRTLWQQVACDAVDLTVEDLPGMTDEPAQRRALAAVYAQAIRPFDLIEGPCARFAIVRMADDHHVVIMGLHHIVTDEWSLQILGREFAAEYPRLASGDAVRAPQRGITFADYAAWEDECRAAGRFDEQYAKWKDVLRPPLPRLDLPWRPRTPDVPEEIETYPIELDGSLSTGLAEIARRERVSLFVVLLSALKRLLRQRSGASDIRVVTNLASRHQRGMEMVVGPLTDTLILRTDLSDDAPLAALHCVRDSFVDACGRHDIPFEELAARLRDEGIRRQDLAQVFFLYDEQSGLPQSIPSLRVEPAPVERSGDFFKTSVHDYDLILYLTGTRGGISGRLALQGELRGGRVADDLLRAYRALLEELVDHAIAA